MSLFKSVRKWWFRKTRDYALVTHNFLELITEFPRGFESYLNTNDGVIVVRLRNQADYSRPEVRYCAEAHLTPEDLWLMVPMGDGDYAKHELPDHEKIEVVDAIHQYLRKARKS